MNTRPIPNTDGRYKASDDGRIFGPSGRELLQFTDKWGYKVVHLRNVDGQERVLRFVHRLVAVTYIPNDDPTKNQINHKDEDKANNSADNLEWCDNLYNQRYGKRIQRIIEARRKPVARLDLDGNILATFDSATTAARTLGLSQGWIWKAIHQGKVAYGSRWAFYPIPPKNLYGQTLQDQSPEQRDALSKFPDFQNSPSHNARARATVTPSGKKEKQEHN